MRLSYHLNLGPRPVALARVGPGWELRWPVPPVHRIEYQFLANQRGAGEHPAYLLDPGNPVQAPGPFGPKSVLELPGYCPPAWLDCEPLAQHRVHVTLSDTPVGEVTALVWSPARTDGERAAAGAGRARRPRAGPVRRPHPLRRGDDRPAAAAGDARHPARARTTQRALRREPQVCRCARRARAAAHPGSASDRPAAGAHGAQPRGPGRTARRMDPPGDLRRAVPAVRVVLHSRDGPAGAAVRVLGRGGGVRRARPRNRSATEHPPGGHDGRDGRGELREQHAARQRGCARWGWPSRSARSPMGTPSRAGATRSTPIWSTC